MASANPFSIIDDSSLTPKQKKAFSRLVKQSYEKDAQVAQKDVEIARKDVEVARKDVEIADARKDAEVARKDAEVARKDAEVLGNRLVSTSTQLFRLQGKLHARGLLGKFSLILRS